METGPKPQDEKKKYDGKGKALAEAVTSSIRHKTWRSYSAEEKIQIVIEGLHGENSVGRFALADN